MRPRSAAMAGRDLVGMGVNDLVVVFAVILNGMASVKLGRAGRGFVDRLDVSSAFHQRSPSET